MLQLEKQCNNNMDAAECLGCTAGSTPALTKSELDQVTQSKKPQLSTTISGPLPFLYPKQDHCEYCHMLTNKLDSDQTDEFIKEAEHEERKQLLKKPERFMS